MEAAEELKSGNQAASTETLIEVADAAPPLIHSVVSRLAFTSRLFTITNVPGPLLAGPRSAASCRWGVLPTQVQDPAEAVDHATG
jgi:hypothetical protein